MVYFDIKILYHHKIPDDSINFQNLYPSIF